MEQNNTLTFTDLIINYPDMWHEIESYLPHLQCCGLPGTCKTLNLEFQKQAMHVFWDSKVDIKSLDFECIERSRHYSNPKSWGPIKPVNSSGWEKHDHKKFPIRTAFVECQDMVQCYNDLGPSLVSLVMINGPRNHSLESMVLFFPLLKYLCCLKYNGGEGDKLPRMLSRAKNLCEFSLVWTNRFDPELFLLPARHWIDNIKTCKIISNYHNNPEGCKIISNCHNNPTNQRRPTPIESTALRSPFLLKGQNMMITPNWNAGSIIPTPTPAVPLVTDVLSLMGNSSFGCHQQQEVQLGYRYTLLDGTERVILINLTGERYREMKFRPELLEQGKIIPVPPKL